MLKEQINELEDACKLKDSSLKRTLQKLEFAAEDLNKANNELDELKNKKQKKMQVVQETDSK